MPSALSILFLVTFLFPTIPRVFGSDTQPWYLVLGLVLLISSRRINKNSLVFIFVISLLSLIEVSASTVYVVVGVLSYFVSAEAVQHIAKRHVEFAIKITILVTTLLLLVFLTAPTIYFSFRDLLGLRDMSLLGRFAALWGENSVLLIFLIQLHVVITVSISDKRIVLIWHLMLAALVVGVGGSAIILLPLVLLWMASLKLLGVHGSIRALDVAGYVLILAILGFYTLFQTHAAELAALIHRSKMVRLYDLMMIPFAIQHNFFGVLASQEVLALFDQTFPGRFQNDDLGTTSAIAKIVLEFGGAPALLIAIFLSRLPGVSFGAFVLFTTTTVGMGLYFLFLLNVRGSAEVSSRSRMPAGGRVGSGALS